MLNFSPHCEIRCLGLTELFFCKKVTTSFVNSVVEKVFVRARGGIPLFAVPNWLIFSHTTNKVLRPLCRNFLIR